ncbi:MAG: flavodoxin family protein [Anaerolineae bacterium]
MKTLVAYMSSTGNTKKVAEAIYGALEGEKELARVQDVLDFSKYDMAFLGFPTHAAGPDAKAKSVLAEKAAGQKVALFTTHGSPAGCPMALEAADGFRQACSGADVLGVFECQGKIAKMVKLFMRFAPDPEIKKGARLHDDETHPDSGDLARAAAWAREMVARAG